MTFHSDAVPWHIGVYPVCVRERVEGELTSNFGYWWVRAHGYVSAKRGEDSNVLVTLPSFSDMYPKYIAILSHEAHVTEGTPGLFRVNITVVVAVTRTRISKEDIRVRVNDVFLKPIELKKFTRV